MRFNYNNRASEEGRAFERFRRDHPHVEQELAEWALAEADAGTTYLCFSELWARYRRTGGPGGARVQFGMDAAFQPFMVRLLITNHPRLEMLFQLRPAFAADAWWDRYRSLSA